jgi:hypothetical protein
VIKLATKMASSASDITQDVSRQETKTREEKVNALAKRFPKKPPSAKPSVAKVSSKEQKSDLEYYFGQLTGTEEPDLDIVKPKVLRLIGDANIIISTISAFSHVVRKLGYERNADELDTFMSNAKTFHSELKVFETKELTGEAWKTIKDHDFIQTCMVACGNLSVIHAQFAHSWDTVDRKFMNRFTGLKFVPFAPWCDLDLKHLWLIDGDTEKDLPELIFTVMKNLFGAMRDMYEAYMNPDVNISHLSDLIISSLGNLRKRIPRCDKAFNKIEESARMLKDNFGEYYRDFLQTKDPNNIFTAFISDVSTSCGNDTALIFQCRKIVEFYKKNAQMKIASGEITGEKRQMFESLLNNYKMLDRNASETAGVPTEGTGELADSDNDDVEAEDTAMVVESQEEDARDLDELMSQIENPKVMNVTVKKSGGKK